MKRSVIGFDAFTTFERLKYHRDSFALKDFTVHIYQTYLTDGRKKGAVS
jgi:hypothetical protein